MSNTSGLVSISFRQHSVEEIIEATVNAGLDAIEWGGDIHVPHGDVKRAEYVASLMQKAGLKTAEYGSYYKIGLDKVEDFIPVAETARALGVSVIRLWAWGIPSQNTDEWYEHMVESAKAVCDLAPDLTLALECHHDSITEEYHDALKYLSDVNKDNFKMFWQPNQFCSFEYNVEAAKALAPYVLSVHVFNWDGNGGKFPLADGRNEWMKYFEALGKRDLNYMLEFVPDNQITTLSREAATLVAWLKELK